MNKYITKTGVKFNGGDEGVYGIGDKDGLICLLEKDTFEKDQIVFIGTKNKQPSESDIEWIKERIEKSSSIGKTKDDEECLFILNDDKEEISKIKSIISGLNIWSFSHEFEYDEKTMHVVNIPLLRISNIKTILENSLLDKKEDVKKIIEERYEGLKQDSKTGVDKFYYHKDLIGFFETYKSETNEKIIDQLLCQGLIDIVEEEINIK